MASNAKALSFLSGDLSLSGTEVSINVAGSVQSDSITGSTITMKNTGSTIVASDGTTAVLSESGGAVTLTADAAVIEGSSSGDLVRITQTGTGNALVVEDSTNPDSTPFVVDASGNVGIGTDSLDQTLVVKTENGGGIGYENSAGKQWRWAVGGSSEFAVIESGVAERMRIETSGRVGIGTNNPSSNLEVSQSETSNTTTLKISNAGSTGLGGTKLSFGENPNTELAYIKNNYENYGGNLNWTMTLASQAQFRFVTDVVGTPTERMRIDPSGNLLVGTIVGTPNPGSVIFPYGGMSLGNNAGSSGFEFATFRRNAVQIGSITQSGTTGVTYATSSDYRLKENITEITDGISRVKQLNPSRFNFISDPENTVDGFIAHEVQDIVPEAISGEKDAVNEDGSINPQGIDQSKLVPLLTAALQESIALIESQQSQIDTLTNKTQEQDFTIASLISRIEALENP